MGKIYYIMGKSASGKDTIYRRLMEDKTFAFHTLVPYTTRPMRAGEAEGVEYHFVNDEEAARLEKEGKVIEMRCYDTVIGVWKYFTVNDGQIRLDGKNRYIVIGTLEAYDGFCKYYGKEHLLPIYIEVEDKIRLLRAIHREEEQEKPKYAELCRRFLADEQDFSEENLKKSGITKHFSNNDGLEDSVAAIKQEILRNIGEQKSRD